MSEFAATSFSGSHLIPKANVYFGGNVISHGFTSSDGAKKSLGLIRPGTYHFGTGAAERMEVVAGSCTVKLDGSDDETTYAPGSFFEIPANSGFDITVADTICEYICTFYVPVPDAFTNVTVTSKANVYFGGNVISHSFSTSDGAKKSTGLIMPGTYHFGTAAAERMEVIAGSCTVKLDGTDIENKYETGKYFDVAANSGFDITVAESSC
eukprot:gene7101-14446_t